jgi:hypothetical protein
MISRKLSTLTLGALLTLSVQCSWRTAANNAENGLGVVRFSKGWSKSTGGRILVLADTNGYVVRRKVSPEPQELIIRMKALITNAEGKSETVFSDEIYAISLDHQFRVRAAAADEWERAEQLDNTRRQIRSNRSKAPSESLRHTENAVSHKEKLFVKSGEFWAEPVGLVSPDGTSLAVFSFSSSAKPQTSWSPLDGSLLQEPRPGEMFVDVFDTSTGERIQSGRARYDGSPSMLFGGALWVGNNYLIVPLDPQNSSDAAGQTCFIGILPPVN